MNISHQGLLGVAHDVVGTTSTPATVKNNGNVVGRSQGSDSTQFGQPATPVHIRLPDVGPLAFQKQLEAIARVLVFPGGHPCRVDLSIEASKAGVVVGWQALPPSNTRGRAPGLRRIRACNVR